MSNIIFRSATELAEMIRNKNTSSVEVLKAHLEHIARHNSKLNAVVTLDEDRAKQRAKEADAAIANGEIWGPLHGVPITVKDSYETREVIGDILYSSCKEKSEEKISS